MAERTTKSNQSLEKALQIIEFMAEHRKPVRLQMIAEALSFPASTTLRFLATLEKKKYVKQDPDTLRYYLTYKLCKIGNLISSSHKVRDIARPYLMELVEKVSESACLAIDDDGKALYIDVVSGPANILRVMQRIGKEAPLHCTGVGKLLLQNYDNNELNELLSKTGMEQLTHNTIVSPEELKMELEKVRQLDYAIDDEECEIGARCVAAPIRNYTGKIVASISVSGPVSRMTFQKIELIKNKLKLTADKISSDLGYEESSKIIEMA